MESDPQDQEIIRYLTKLKDVNEEYPENLLVAQRHRYLKRMIEINLGVSRDTAIRNPKTTAHSPHASALLETLLVVAIAAEAGLAAYLYRDQLSSFFDNPGIVSNVSEVPLPAADPISPEVQGVNPSTAIPEELPVVTVTPTGTPVPSLFNDTPEVDLLEATPITTENNGNSGNHYGQTPKPERTKENNGNNEKPPKDNKPPKGEPKPTKDK